MRYRLTNKTRIPTKYLKTLIEFSLPEGVDDVKIIVMYDDTQSAWHGIQIQDKKLIKIWIAKKDEDLGFPRFSNSPVMKKCGYNPIFKVNNIYEVLVSLFAHELRHVWQKHVSKQNFSSGRLCKYKDWDGKIHYSIYRRETDACKYAKKILDKYKKI